MKLACLPLAAALAAGVAANPAPLGSPELAAALDAALEEAGVPGAAVALVHRDHPPWIHTYGRRGVGDEPVRPDTLFRVSSISKTPLALAVLRLAEAGRLRLEARVRELLPEVPVVNPWEGEHPLRLVHLLEHTSGLPDFHFPEILRPAEELGEPPPPARYRLAADPRWLRCRWPPGERYAYTNRGPALAAAVLEAVTERPWLEVVRTEVLEPLGLTDGGYVLDPERLARLAHGHEDSRAPPVTPRPAYFLPAANWSASVQDLARLTRFFLRRGEDRLSPATISRMERPGSTRAAAAGLFTGWGPGLVSRVNRSRVTWGHYGGGYAYQATFRYLPDQGVGWVAMVNASDQRRALGVIQELLYDALEVPAARPRSAPVSPEARALAGYYLPGNPRHEVLALPQRLLTGGWLVAGEEGLRWRPVLPGGRSPELVPWGMARGSTGAHLALRRAQESGPSLVALEADGEPTVLTGEDHYLVRQAWPWPALALYGLALAALGAACGTVGAVVAVARRRERYEGVMYGVLATLAWVAGLGAVASLEVHELGAWHARAALVFACTLAQPALALLALPCAIYRRSGWGWLLALSHLALAAGLWQAGWLGLRLWAD